MLEHLFARENSSLTLFDVNDDFRLVIGKATGMLDNDRELAGKGVIEWRCEIEIDAIVLRGDDHVVFAFCSGLLELQGEHSFPEF